MEWQKLQKQICVLREGVAVAGEGGISKVGESIVSKIHGATDHTINKMQLCVCSLYGLVRMPTNCFITKHAILRATYCKTKVIDLEL